MNNSKVKTIDLNHGRTGSAPFSFTCPENTHEHINDAYSPLNDAHYFGETIFDMYKKWLGTPLSLSNCRCVFTIHAIMRMPFGMAHL